MTPSGDVRRGAALVLASAVVWSLGGAIARYLSVSDSWTIVFWRSLFAAAFLLVFMLWRHGAGGSATLVRSMGWPGVAVGLCFTVASISFVVALSHTTVANILLMQAGVPLWAALMAFVMFGEQVARATWLSIATVIVGVLIMVSGSLGGQISPVGDGLALLIALAFAAATVITRRHAEVKMMPAVLFGTATATLIAATQAGGFEISGQDAVLLFLFGAMNLGLGLAFFVTGAPLIPAAMAALIGTAEPVLGPLWVWWVHGEVPGARTLVGGGVVLFALLAHLVWQARRQR
jgi:drug/metabolite transporter (DMT)-like permease